MRRRLRGWQMTPGPIKRGGTAGAASSPAGPCWCRGSISISTAAHRLLSQLPLRARCPARRPDGLVCQRRRRRRPARRFIRRLLAAAAGPAALAHRPRGAAANSSRGVPLKILANFVAEQEWLLDAGDMLYLPPGWGHDGVADGEMHDVFDRLSRRRARRIRSRGACSAACMQRPNRVDRVGRVAAVSRPRPAGDDEIRRRFPTRCRTFAAEAVARLVGDSKALACSLGEWLSEPKPQVWFDEAPPIAPQWRCAARHPHPHAVGRVAYLHQWRIVPGRRPRCAPDAPAGRPARSWCGRSGAARPAGCAAARRVGMRRLAGSAR